MVNYIQDLNPQPTGLSACNQVSTICLARLVCSFVLSGSAYIGLKLTEDFSFQVQNVVDVNRYAAQRVHVYVDLNCGVGVQLVCHNLIWAADV